MYTYEPGCRCLVPVGRTVLQQTVHCQRSCAHVLAWLLLSGAGRSESLAADGDVSMGQTAILGNSGSVKLAEESPLS